MYKYIANFRSEVSELFYSKRMVYSWDVMNIMDIPSAQPPSLSWLMAYMAALLQQQQNDSDLRRN